MKICYLVPWISQSRYQLIDNAHADMIHKVIEIDNKRIASCSRDLTVKLWKGK